MSTDLSAEQMEQRYGVRSPWRRGLTLAVAAALVLAFGGWLAWTITDQSTPAVTSDLETYSFEGQHSATAVLVISLAAADVDATCRLRATAADHTVVGELNFSPDPAQGRRQVQEIRTERRATSVESLGCTAAGQTRPR